MWSLTSAPGFKTGKAYCFFCVFSVYLAIKRISQLLSFLPTLFSYPFEYSKTLCLMRKVVACSCRLKCGLGCSGSLLMRKSSRTLGGLTAWVWRTPAMGLPRGGFIFGGWGLWRAVFGLVSGDSPDIRVTFLEASSSLVNYMLGCERRVILVPPWLLSNTWKLGEVNVNPWLILRGSKETEFWHPRWASSVLKLQDWDQNVCTGIFLA